MSSPSLSKGKTIEDMQTVQNRQRKISDIRVMEMPDSSGDSISFSKLIGQRKSQQIGARNRKETSISREGYKSERGADLKYEARKK